MKRLRPGSMKNPSYQYKIRIRSDQVMNKKQMDSKTANKNFSKKVAPLVMSTSFIAASFLAAGAPISAAELDTKDVNTELIEHAKNHGQKVSEFAKSLPGSPEKGKLVSQVAQQKNETTDELEDKEIDDATDDGVAEEPETPVTEEDATVETPAAGDDLAEDVTEEPGVPVTEDDQAEEGEQEDSETPAAEEPAEDVTEEPGVPVTEDDQAEEGEPEETETPIAAEPAEVVTEEPGVPRSE